MVDSNVKMQVAYASAILSVLCLGLICMKFGNQQNPSEQLEVFQRSVRGPKGRWGVQLLVPYSKARKQSLWGGDGLVTTGDYVDGRKTVPGLHTDCIPGVLRSDCSPAQEDGAWSKEAAAYIDRHTNGKHSQTMDVLQKNVDRAFKARDDFLNACLKDWRNCNKPAEEVTGYDDRIDDQNEAATFGIQGPATTDPWAFNYGKPALKDAGVPPPEQYSEYNPRMSDGAWNDVPLPSGANGDGLLTSTAYYASDVSL
mmetsp:Transcript_30621/g.98567  ORF Transcript_30621/g.98567 Transcript_30621/m.98567 type:complete len:255 (-) Transcript_30621:40-804(-)